MKYLWVIEQHSSTTVFYHSSSNIDIDPNLVSGLLMALNNFSQVELKGHGIESIEMDGMRWVYLNELETSNLLLISADDIKSDAYVARSRLNIIHSMFVDKYSIKKETFSGKLVNINQFDNFNDEILMLQDQWNQAELMLASATLFDLLGIYQQVLDDLFHLVRTYVSGGKLEIVYRKNEQLMREFKDWPEIYQNPELAQIEFDRENGYDCINVNTMFLDEDVLRFVLTKITENAVESLRTFLNERDLALYLQNDIFPYLISEYDLMERLKIAKPLLRIFSLQYVKK